MAGLPGPGCDFATDRVSDDLTALTDRVAAAPGVGRIAVVDLTRADIGLPVVRVVAEGLEGAGAIYGGGSVPGARATTHSQEMS